MNELLGLLNKEIALLQIMVDLLEREDENLAERRYGQLPELAARKDKVAERLSACDAQREALLVAMGFSADRAGADAAARAGHVLWQAWTRVLELAGQARELNHRNGVVVHAHLDFMRQSIAFLQKGSRPLYGPNGQHSAAGTQGLRYAAG